MVRRLCGLIGVWLSVLITPYALAQTTTVPANASSAPTSPVVSNSWASLTKAQQGALDPLAKAWNHLSESQRRKWLAIAQNYPHLAASEQEKLHSRMVEWASLSTRDRELARLNFAQTKSVDKADRAANWEAYQALSPEDRKKLAEGAKGKPVGAAVAVKPVAPDKLAAVPVTRHTPESERAVAAVQMSLNRNTLLPQNVEPKPVNAGDSISPPAPASKP